MTIVIFFFIFQKGILPRFLNIYFHFKLFIDLRCGKIKLMFNNYMQFNHSNLILVYINETIQNRRYAWFIKLDTQSDKTAQRKKICFGQNWANAPLSIKSIVVLLRIERFR